MVAVRTETPRGSPENNEPIAPKKPETKLEKAAEKINQVKNFLSSLFTSGAKKRNESTHVIPARHTKASDPSDNPNIPVGQMTSSVTSGRNTDKRLPQTHKPLPQTPTKVSTQSAVPINPRSRDIGVDVDAVKEEIGKFDKLLGQDKALAFEKGKAIDKKLKDDDALYYALADETKDEKGSDLTLEFNQKFVALRDELQGRG